MVSVCQKTVESLDIEEALLKLEKELLNLNQLCLSGDRRNIFRILKVSNMELRHSNFLAWLLNPLESHGLGDRFLRLFLEEFAKTGGPDSHLFLNNNNLYLSDTIIQREFDNMDLVIRSKRSKFIMVIENKIRSKENEDQTPSYRGKIEKCYGKGGKNGFENKFYVFLTVDGGPAQDKHWVSMKHAQIIQILDKIIPLMKEGSRERTYVEDYRETLYMVIKNNSPEIKEICERIYYENTEAVEILFGNLPDPFIRRSTVIREAIKECGGHVISSTDNKFIAFTTDEMENTSVKTASGDIVPLVNFLFIQIENPRDKDPLLRVRIGPKLTKDLRRGIINHLASKLETTKVTNTEKWTCVYSAKREIDIKKDEKEQLRVWIKQIFETDFPGKVMLAVRSYDGFTCIDNEDSDSTMQVS